MSAAHREPLFDRIEILCARMDSIGGAGITQATASVREELRTRQLRLAVVGSVKAGKSTLVNALLARRVAPTSEAECTRIVTHYRYGAPEHGEAHMLDGATHQFFLQDRRMPEQLPWAAEQISHAVVYLQEATLRDFTLIDTPGLATTTVANATATRRAILEARQADALVYVFHGVQRADDAQFLKDFAAAAGRSDTDTTVASAVSIGVMSHADTFGDGPWGEQDPLELAAKQAAAIAGTRTAELATVIPVAGRLAESALTGLLTEPLTNALAELEGAPAENLRFPDEDHVALLDAIIDVVGDYGLRYGRSAAKGGSRELATWMHARANTAALHDALRARYVGRHPELKARQAVLALRRAANAAGAPYAMRLAQEISEALLDPALHPLEEMRTWEELRATHPSSPLLADLDRLVAEPDDARRVGLGAASESAAIRAAALRRVAHHHRETSLAGDPAIADANRTLERSFTLIARRHTD